MQFLRHSAVLTILGIFTVAPFLLFGATPLKGRIAKIKARVGTKSPGKESVSGIDAGVREPAPDSPDDGAAAPMLLASAELGEPPASAFSGGPGLSERGLSRSRRGAIPAMPSPPAPPLNPFDQSARYEAAGNLAAALRTLQAAALEGGRIGPAVLFHLGRLSGELAQDCGDQEESVVHRLQAVSFLTASIDAAVMSEDAKGAEEWALRSWDLLQTLKRGTFGGVWPVSTGRISSSYGRRKHPIRRRWRMHTGLDIAAPAGTPVRAVGWGKVARQGWHRGYGWFIEVRYESGYSVLYAHLRERPEKRPGARVLPGMVVGRVGSTGLSTGPHLHFEVRNSAGKRLDPATVFRFPDGARVGAVLSPGPSADVTS